MGIVNTVRAVVSSFTRAPRMYGYTETGADFSGQAASDLIRKELLLVKPSLICRFGSNELNAAVGYRYPFSFHNLLLYLKSQVSTVGWSTGTIHSLVNNAGFFPGDPEYIERFVKLMIEDMQHIDILGTWIRQEFHFKDDLTKAKRILLQDLEPFHHKDPWTTVLEGKKILVVHPFENSILHQYKKHTLLFSDHRFLPVFELHTIKAIQTIGRNQSPFPTWFDALDHMKTQIDRCDFDIALLGCGAYGFPLAAYIKRTGKKAVHIGGALQILFGIKGSRWEQRPFYSNMMNDHWIKPLPEDTPYRYQDVENGCYW
jgi:hypothetical protein